MTSRERLLAAYSGQPVDHTPLTTWSFGFPAPPALRWERDGRPVDYWYSLRLEYLHTLPQPWTLPDDFRRVLAWRSLGVDDLLEVSLPWSMAPEVTYRDTVIPAGQQGPYRILVREYQTPAGPLRHAVKQTAPEPPGWVIQPDYVPLLEDFNIPRAVEHAVSSPADVPIIRHLFAPPDDAARRAFTKRMAAVGEFSRREGVAVHAWSAFGMDGVVWLAGAQGAVLLALDEPRAFGELVEIVAATDLARTKLALTAPEVDLIIQRGWYSSTDFWSPTLFTRYVLPHLTSLAELVHRHDRKLGYVMTTGVRELAPRLAQAGVDVLFFLDPLQDGVPLDWARDHLADRLALVGGLNALTLNGSPADIRSAVHRALDTLAATNRLILHPLDALFPDTPWDGVTTLIEAWKEYQ